MKKVLEYFMKDNFPYSEFRKAGIFTKEMKNDYEAQVKCICDKLSLDTIFDYSKHEIRCHISYVSDGIKVNVDRGGKLTVTPFVEIYFPNQLHI